MVLRDGVRVVMAVYNLLPSYRWNLDLFSQRLKGYIPNLAEADFQQPFEKIKLDPW